MNGNKLLPSGDLKGRITPYSIKENKAVGRNSRHDAQRTSKGEDYFCPGAKVVFLSDHVQEYRLSV